MRLAVTVVDSNGETSKSSSLSGTNTSGEGGVKCCWDCSGDAVFSGGHWFCGSEAVLLA